MYKKAFIGFSLVIAVLLICFQLLWGLRWIQYYVNYRYVKQDHLSGELSGPLDLLSDTDEKNSVSPYEMTLEPSKTAPPESSSDPSPYRLIQSTAKHALRHATVAVETAMKPLGRQKKKRSDFYLLKHKYPGEIISPNLPPPCKENEAYVASPAFCEQASTPFYFLLVMSAAGNFDERHGLRNLFLRSRFHMSPEFMKQYSWKYVFLVGKPNSKSKKRNAKVQRNVNEESRRFKDILQVDVLESYYNLTMKKMAAFDFLIQSNITFEILQKTDDDCFVNIQLVIEWLIAVVPSAYDRIRNKLKTKGKSVSNSTKYFFGGHCRYNSKPIRGRQSKWYLSKTVYKDEYFPPFCFGVGYFLSYDVIKAIISLPASDQMRWFPLEDVHMGLLVNKSGVISGEDVKNTDHIMNGGISASCVRGGGYPLTVVTEGYLYVRSLYEDFVERKSCG